MKKGGSAFRGKLIHIYGAGGLANINDFAGALFGTSKRERGTKEILFKEVS